MAKRTPKLQLPGSLARSLKRISFSGRGRRTETNLNILCMCQPPSQVASQKHLHSGCIGKKNFPPGRPGPKNLTKVRMQIIIKLQLAFNRIQDENDGDPISQKKLHLTCKHFVHASFVLRKRLKWKKKRKEKKPFLARSTRKSESVIKKVSHFEF